jgi:hypothetical protein
MMFRGARGRIASPATSPEVAHHLHGILRSSDLLANPKERLKLEQKKGPVDILVVDHIEKAPTEN